MENNKLLGTMAILAISGIYVWYILRSDKRDKESREMTNDFYKWQKEIILKEMEIQNPNKKPELKLVENNEPEPTA